VTQDNEPRLDLSSADNGALCISLIGDWDLTDRLPSQDLFGEQVKSRHDISQVTFNSEQIGTWDSSLLVFIGRIEKYCTENGLQLDMSGLPSGIKRLRDLAREIPPIEDTATHETIETLLSEIGKTTLDLYHGISRNLKFIGEVILSFGRLIRNKAQFRSVDLMLIIQQVGPNALPIVSLVSFLVGLILAYMGAAQLERVGVQIYIADLVGIAMIREVGALMTGIIMAGRTGASFAAELGTMQVNEEIDAFKTLGISTIDFLVLPRILALMLMIPLLTLYSGLVGTLAGLIIGVTVFDISLFEYYQQTIQALNLKSFGVGIFKGAVYGAVVAISGCLRGMQCGRSAQAVGEATTSAVVTSIIFIVITASAMTVALYKLGI